jgi:hypothetical protein
MPYISAAGAPVQTVATAQANPVATAPAVSTGNPIIDMLMAAFKTNAAPGAVAAAGPVAGVATPAAISESAILARKIREKDPELMRILTDYPKVVDANGNVNQDEARKLGFSDADHKIAYQIQIAANSIRPTSKQQIATLANNGQLAGIIEQAGDDGLQIAGVGAALILKGNGAQTYNFGEVNKALVAAGMEEIPKEDENSQIAKGAAVVRLARADALPENIADLYQGNEKDGFEDIIEDPGLLELTGSVFSSGAQVANFIQGRKVTTDPPAPAAGAAPAARDASTATQVDPVIAQQMMAYFQSVIGPMLAKSLAGGAGSGVGTINFGANAAGMFGNGMGSGMGAMPFTAGAAGQFATSQHAQLEQMLGINTPTPFGTPNFGAQASGLIPGFGNDGANLLGAQPTSGGFRNLSNVEIQALQVLNASQNKFVIQQV